ncbi:Glucose/Sorbosone dehydrogenase domain-containing protein [Mesobacillus thioparans]
MEKVKVSLHPIVSKINLPTVIKTAILPGDSIERLFIATQIGEIFYIGNGDIKTFLDIRPQVLKLGVQGGGYDERGLLGLAFHPHFNYNGLFYLHYSVAGSQGPGALPETFMPDPCDPNTLNRKWVNREVQFDHIDTVEEWILQADGQPQKRRTLLNLRRPFFNHNGVNSLNFSPETGKLVFTTGDGGLGYDPFNLSQDDMEIAGKIIEIDVIKNTSFNNPHVVTRFNELPAPIQEILTVIAKGVRNIPGISFQRNYIIIILNMLGMSDRIWQNRFFHSFIIERYRLLNLY